MVTTEIIFNKFDEGELLVLCNYFLLIEHTFIHSTMQKDPSTGEMFVRLTPEEYQKMKKKIKNADEEMPTTQPAR